MCNVILIRRNLLNVKVMAKYAAVFALLSYRIFLVDFVQKIIKIEIKNEKNE